MVVTILVFLAFIIVGYYSSVDMLGLYLFLLIIHGIFVRLAGADFQNAPALIGVLVILMVLSKKKLDYWRHREIKLKYIILYVAIFLAMIIAGFTGIDYDNSMFYMHLYMKGFVLTLLVYLLVDSRKGIERISFYYMLGAVAGAIWVGYEFYTDSFSGGDEWTRRAAGLRADPNNTAMLMVPGVPLAYYFSLKAGRRLWRYALLALIPFLIWALALTGSRGGMLSMTIVMLMIIFNKPTIMKILVTVAVVAGVVLASPGVLFERSSHLTSTQKATGDGSIAARLDLLLTGAKVFAQRPILGVGPGNFGHAMIAYKLRGDVDAKVPEYLFGDKDKLPVAHNMFLEVFAELGVIGGLLFFGVVYFSLSNFWRGHRAALRESEYFSLGYALFVAMVGFLIAGLFLSQGKESVLWFLLGLGLAFHLQDTTLEERQNEGDLLPE